MHTTPPKDPPLRAATFIKLRGEMFGPNAEAMMVAVAARLLVALEQLPDIYASAPSIAQHGTAIS